MAEKKKQMQKLMSVGTDPKSKGGAPILMEDDQSSDSSEDSEPEDKAYIVSDKIEVVEQEFPLNQKLSFSDDVYNYTMAANMTRCVSPIQRGFIIKQCFIVFGIQLLVPTFFILELGLSNFQELTTSSLAIRIICALLLHLIIKGEVVQSINILRYLKFSKTAKGGKRGRFVNIILCTMQIMAPFFAETVL